MIAPTADVIIIGGGLAGLSAAVALSSTPLNVTLLERKPYVGGRAYSYPHPALDEVIDSQHVLLGCCTNLIDLCERSDSSRFIRWYDAVTFLEPSQANRAARKSEVNAGMLPAPLHSSWSFLRAPMLSVVDKARVAAGLVRFMRGVPAADREAFSQWLERTRQTERAIRHFWEPVVMGALNDNFDRCSTRYAAQVFHESFLKSGGGGRLGIPTQPLSEFYAQGAKLAERQGTDLRLRTSVERIEHHSDGQWHVTASDGQQYSAAQVLLAVPFEAAARLLQMLPEGAPQRSVVLSDIGHFSHAPITTVHLWFDREVSDLDHAALLDTRIQWMFNKTRIRRTEALSSREPGQYIELVISGSFSELGKSRDEVLYSALDEFAQFFPEVRKARLVKSGVLKEARATFSVVPDLDRWRPANDAPGEGLFLAGDWTRTHWPSTMEGAVRSGRLAAEAICKSLGSGQKFLSPDLPATGLMRLLARN
jgi:squalene-associated FAD-dependent desaturase